MGHQSFVAARVGAQGFEVNLSALDMVLAQGDGEIPTPQERAHPGRGDFGIAIRGWVIERRMAHATEVIDNLEAGVGASAGGTKGGDHEIEGALEFVSALPAKFFRSEKRAQRSPNIAARLCEDGCDLANRIGGRFVSDKTAAKL